MERLLRAEAEVAELQANLALESPTRRLRAASESLERDVAILSRVASEIDAIESFRG